MGDHLRLTLEAPHQVGRGLPVPLRGGSDQLDRRGPRQHAVPRTPDLAHPADAQSLLQAVAPQLASGRHLPPQPVDDPGAEVGEDHRDDRPEDRPEVVIGMHRRLAAEVEQQKA